MRIIIALTIAYCVFELSRTALFCYRSDRLRKQVEQLPKPEDYETAMDNHFRITVLAEKQRDLESSWWLWPHRFPDEVDLPRD